MSYNVIKCNICLIKTVVHNMECDYAPVSIPLILKTLIQKKYTGGNILDYQKINKTERERW